MTSPQWQDALEAAILAPSPHNTQPWRFEVTGDQVDVLLDESRVLAVADPGGREARMSCGAALFNLRMALRSQGLPVHVWLTPDADRRDLLARVRVSGHLAARADELVLYKAIPRRRTNRRPFRDDPVGGDVQMALRQAALHEGARLVLLVRPQRYDAVSTLLRFAENSQRQDVGFQDELLAWVAEDPDRLDGVPPLASGPPPLIEPLVLLRHYGSDGDKRPREYEQEPLLGVLLTHRDDARDHMRAGQALQRVLLTATAGEVSTSFLSAAVERSASRSALTSVLGEEGYPQAVLRFGYGYLPPHTRRRPVDEVSTCL
ncbi:nitroreductase [Kibdelosporangium philippinense]|uniref:Nitroreductase n=2 Tax=Kibdelosporangium philippinense TaxID=211113 RepID=A0ABS8Z2A8_9PSEU|nr:nitroreductase family protein [Kibdelosporangium philippinense]MCE7002076.1 nitroreductase [Kibdelosporangium philippinense]MCE7004686.1 nitroreductase [Kibdelosporangium philippinense]